MALIEELNLSTKALHVLQNFCYDRPDDYYETICGLKYKGFYNIYTIEDLIRQGIPEISKRPQAGPKTLNEIAFKVKEFAQRHQIKFDEDRFINGFAKKQVTVDEYYLKKQVIKTGWVYAISCQNFLKIGKTCSFPSNRLKALNTGCPFELRLKGYFPSSSLSLDERLIHKELNQYKHKLEWFCVEYEQLKNIIIKEWVDFHG